MTNKDVLALALEALVIADNMQKFGKSYSCEALLEGDAKIQAAITAITQAKQALEAQPFVVGGPHVREKMLKDQIRKYNYNPVIEVPQTQGEAVGELASPEYDLLRASVQPTAMPFVPWSKEAEMIRSWTVQPQSQKPLEQ